MRNRANGIRLVASFSPANGWSACSTPGSPFLEIGQLAANDLYHGEVPGAGLIVDKCSVPAKDLGAESGDIGVLGRHAEMKIWTLALPKNARKSD